MNDRTPIQRGDRVLVWATVRGPCNDVEPGRMWWVEIDGKPTVVAMDEALFVADGEKGNADD